MLATIGSAGFGDSEQSGAVQVVDADEPTAGAVSIAAGDELTYPSLAVAAEYGAGDAFWLYEGNIAEPRWHQFRLDDGERLDVIDAVPFGAGPVPGSGPEVAGSPSGGVFRRTDDGYRLVAPGRPIAARGHEVLVRSCSSPTQCTLAWLDRDNGRPIDRPVPDPGQAQFWFGSIVPGSDRYLLGLEGGGIAAPLPVVFDLETGRTVDIGLGNWPLSSSPDGRYLLVGDDGGSPSPAIIDVETGERYDLRRPSTTNIVAVFVPNG